jgi:exonuclease SbcC
VLLTRLYLQNYRVYEDPLDLELPPGLVGIYGANGSGKSTLLEAILFCLWGKARTPKEDLRTAGVGGDCVAEVEFEHEGHLYLVRRTLSGVTLAAKAEAHCDGLAMASGIRETGRYLHQVLGMDDAAFRASVFAEQKQLAAFSDRTPAERRQLVLQLLGITPLDVARDGARKDAREAAQHHERLRGMLPDLDQLRVEADDAASAAAAAAATAETEEAAAGTARARAVRAEEVFTRLDRVRQEYDTLVVEGRAARSQLAEAVQSVAQLETEQAELEHAEAELAEIAPRAEGVAGVEVALELVRAVVAAERARAALTVAPEPPVPHEAAAEAARVAADEARAAVAGLAGQLAAVRAELARANEQAARSAGLSGAADCPLCGQALGDAFEQVQAHRAAEVREAEARLAALHASRRSVDARAAATVAEFKARTAEVVAGQRARVAWEQMVTRVADADQALTTARAALASKRPDLMPLPGSLAPLLTELVENVARRREAAAAVQRLRGRLERRPAVANLLDHARERVADDEHRVTVLLDKVRGLGFDPAALAAAATERRDLAAASERSARSAADARVASERAATLAGAEARRLADGEAQHAKLASLAADVRHLGRVAELMSAFRNTIVASVGPRLAVQAAELFGELTDNEYDTLKVNSDTYEMQICDGGRDFGLDRFSGSEIDLANLALRVAISEHVRFQSGGTVGLLVLDEVFGPLDEDRKARMLQALERLRGRFRQILVVTHDVDIKEQLPSAIEVRKLPGRRATAHLLNN